MLVNEFRRRGIAHQLHVLPCGHYSTGVTPFKWMDGLTLCRFLNQSSVNGIAERRGFCLKPGTCSAQVLSRIRALEGVVEDAASARARRRTYLGRIGDRVGDGDGLSHEQPDGGRGERNRHETRRRRRG